ncbi:PEBP family protein [Pilimelia anulata]|uniref:PEBP family protein n=1 Tax=Pilimelia anulata TaxID=53371 RepID=A0A8J3B6B3_9ACTN|nr:YbhB/YbcL family Raf kinase inhibitor-like protein [Pilimelia anulata]GGJ96785.1 PEBP family protein [Pilimelia anulata]
MSSTRVSDEHEPFGRPPEPLGFPYEAPLRGVPGALLTVRSDAFDEHAPLPPRLSRPGGNVSPPLAWSGVPDTAEELILLCEDPDAPGDEPFLHWLVTGIDPHTAGVGEGRVPPGAREWPNGFGETGWSGPQPPVGDGPHRYVFRLFAVDAPLDLPAHPDPADVHRALAGHELAGAATVGTFAR